jgi:hypothetical protein
VLLLINYAVDQSFFIMPAEWISTCNTKGQSWERGLNNNMYPPPPLSHLSPSLLHSFPFLFSLPFHNFALFSSPTYVSLILPFFYLTLFQLLYLQLSCSFPSFNFPFFTFPSSVSLHFLFQVLPFHNRFLHIL